ncbi:MAG: hypothetical protein JST40_02195 [Armatimonadetes bacterium]|nr:hypothetical protein [Armatimonadota bacterium]
MFAASLFFALGLLNQPATKAPAPTPFSQAVLKAFESWDKDHDGKLTQLEVDSAALDPQNRGEQAAALAALHGWFVVAIPPLPELNKDWFENYKPERLVLAKGTAADEAKKQRKAYLATPGSLQASYAACFRRLSRAGERALFDSDGPTLNDIRQGSLGDCFMLAPLGAIVQRDPNTIKKMVRRNADGYMVRFPDGKEIQVAKLTDTELAMVGSSTQAGLWIRVMENAYGTRRIKEGETKMATDTMRGGSTSAAARILTGHAFVSTALIGDYKKEVSAELLEAKMKPLRSAIPQAVAEHRLVLASTGKNTMPRSISPNHAYAVFGYDPATDKVTLWNPHGNDFSPKGEESPVNGYKLDDGVFSVPLEMFVRAFGRVYFEK